MLILQHFFLVTESWFSLADAAINENRLPRVGISPARSSLRVFDDAACGSTRYSQLEQFHLAAGVTSRVDALAFASRLESALFAAIRLQCKAPPATVAEIHHMSRVGLESEAAARGRRSITSTVLS
jgi:hypothetical protein